MTKSVLAFVVGCTLGALLYAWLGVLCFWMPPVLVLGAISMRNALADAETQNNLPRNV
jgi:uncharacterized membrane protein YoaK (UPF0700 family)